MQALIQLVKRTRLRPLTVYTPTHVPFATAISALPIDTLDDGITDIPLSLYITPKIEQLLGDGSDYGVNLSTVAPRVGPRRLQFRILLSRSNRRLQWRHPPDLISKLLSRTLKEKASDDCLARR